MASEEETFHRLRELDNAISSLTTSETMDSRVSSEYGVTGSPVPSKKSLPLGSNAFYII